MTTEHKSRAIEALDKLYEFEQEPVSEDKLQPGRYFAASYAGEHVAGTEFVIGALFVSWGATAKDIFLGLLLGNLMAVLTWAFFCAPIAVQTRLTLYWYLRRIAGPVTTTIYNILNAILFCILAGCMITVSASAIRIPFGIPEQTNWYPGRFSLRFNSAGGRSRCRNAGHSRLQTSRPVRGGLFALDAPYVRSGSGCNAAGSFRAGAWSPNRKLAGFLGDFQ